jgi:ATP-dependent DNA helicase RecQ
MQTIHTILKTNFGYDSFRSQQEEIIQTILQKKDTLVLMPTGGGKSICFQVPALYFEKTTLVISPLISLMKDQVESLKANGIQASFINSSLKDSERRSIIADARLGKIKLLYVSPENLIAGINTWLNEIEIDLIAVDEAHCVSMWGHDFRPEYTMIKELKKKFSSVPIVALTATADKTTRNDIIQQLNLENPVIFSSSFDRPNLSLEVMGNKSKKEKTKEIIDFIRSRPDESGIIYCLSRKETESWSQILNEYGIQNRFYHAGIENEERAFIQEEFVKDNTPIICATIAFGMGIDKSNVRWIIHTNLPKNMEGYYQEIGRAGRDSMPSITRLYFSYRDVVLLSDFANQSEKKEVLVEKLNRMIQYAESSSCRRRMLLAYFGETISENCGNCDICKNPPEYTDGTLLAQKALSAIKRTDEKISQNTLIEILRGSKTAAIFNENYHQIKTYGIGADISFKEWQHAITEFKNLGLIDIAYDDHMRLKITEFGNLILFDKKTIHISKYEIKEQHSQKKSTKKETFVPEPLSAQENIFNKLKLLRRKIAVELNLPPYIVFHDSTLHEISLKLPKSESEFLEINGVSALKLEKYGSEFIALVNTFLEDNRPKLNTFEETFVLLKQDKSIAEIAEIRKLHETTIFSHLAKLVSDGYSFEVNKYISQEEVNRITQISNKIEHNNQLKPIFEALNEEIEYGKIRLALALNEKV